MALVTIRNSKFYEGDNPLRFIGINNFPLINGTVSASVVRSTMDYAVSQGIKVIRTWCFDVGYLPTNTAGNFRYLDYPLSGNILTNPSFETNTSGWGLDNDFTRSNEDAYSGSYSIKQVSSGGFENFTTTNNATGIAVDTDTDYTFAVYYKMSITSGLGPIININHTSAFGSSLGATGSLGSTGGEWVKVMINFNSGAHNKVWIKLTNNGGTLVGFWDAFHIGPKQAPELAWREAQFVQTDLILDEARKRNLKVILSLADNPTYHTKETYIRWSDTLYGTDYYTPVTRSVSSIVRSGNICTATTTANHGYHIGQLVDIAGATPSNMNGTAKFVRSVPTPTSFTYSASGDDGSATGTITAVRNSGYLSQNFFRDENCKRMYKEFFYKLATRVNTINGRSYKDDDSIFAWEMGNELRYDQDNDPGINTQNSHNLSVISGMNGRTPTSYQYAVGWAEEMADYFKFVDPNHLVSYGDMSHTWQWVEGDTVSNGTYYGVDYNYLIQLSNIDYLDFHVYPYQGDNQTLQKFGQRLGYPNSVTGEGYKAQIIDYVKAGLSSNKPTVIGEIGIIKGTTKTTNPYPTYPRVEHFNQLFKDFYNTGGGGIIFWSYSLTDNNNYNIYPLGQSTSLAGNANDDNRPILDLFYNWNRYLNGVWIRTDNPD